MVSKAAEAVLDSYKAEVRKEAIRVAARQNWCDDGLNETLRNLGLPEKKTYRIPVTLTETRTVFLSIRDAESEDDAKAKATTPDFVRDNISLYGALLTAVVPEAKDPDEQVKGDLDTTYVRRRQCENYGTSGYYCTRESEHGGKQHIAGNGEVVTDVWPVATPAV